MKKMGFMAVLLSTVMVLIAIPTLQAGAAETTYYSLADLLGNEYVTRKSKDGPWLEQTAAKWLPGINPTPLCEQGDAFEMKLRTTARVDISADSSNGRFYMYIGPNGDSWIKTQNDVLVRAQDSNLANNWITLLVINNGQGFDVHYKLDTDAGYRPATYQTDSKCALASSTAVCLSGTAFDVEYVKYYFGKSSILETETKAADCNLLYGQEFDGSAVEGKSLTTGIEGEADVSDGSLNMLDGQATILLDATIPERGYAEVRFKMESGLNIWAGDGTANTVSMNLKTGINLSNYAPSSSGAWVAYSSNVGHDPERYHTYRIVRNADRTYSAYHQIEGEPGWTKQIGNSDINWRLDASSPRLSSGGRALIDYVRIYGPADEDGFFVTDGSYTTLEVKDNSILANPTDIRAMVQGVSGVLIFAGYDAADALVEAKSYTADGTSGGVSQVYNAKETPGITTVKVFLWEDFAALTPLTDNRVLVVE